MSCLGSPIGASSGLKHVCTLLLYNPSNHIAIDLFCVEKYLVVDTCLGNVVLRDLVPLVEVAPTAVGHPEDVGQGNIQDLTVVSVWEDCDKFDLTNACGFDVGAVR